MKLNQDKKLALLALKRLIEFYLSEETLGEYCLSAREYNLVKKYLGIDLKQAMRFKKEVEQFCRGCDKKYLKIYAPFSPWHDANKISKHYFFPMQVKDSGIKNQC